MAVTPGAAVDGVRLLLVDDSSVQRRYLRSAIEATTEFSVVGEARNGREAVAMAERLRPAAILMDLDLPLMNGLDAIERIMAIRPTPIVVYSAFVDEENRANAMEAFAAGAVDVIAKPQWGEGGRLDEYGDELRRRLRVAARVKVITHPRGRLRGGVAAQLSRVVRNRLPAGERPRSPAQQPVRKPAACRLVAIGASTGGPQAVASLLGVLPPDFRPAVLVVQHMAEGFIPGLVSWLDDICPLPVVQGQSGKRLQPGTVTVAPSGLNLVVLDQLRVVCEPAPARQFHVPGIDASFHSIADWVGDEAIGVVLTGMGRDGAFGLKALHDRGAVTIGQDEATSAVYGMPAAAFAAGAVDYQLPLADIAPMILELLRPDGP